MVRQRLLTAFVIIPLPMAAVWFGEPWFTALVALLGVLAVLEFYRLGTGGGLTLLGLFGTLLTVVFITSRDAALLERLGADAESGLLTPTLLTLAIGLTLIAALARRHKGGALSGWAWTLAGVLYVGWFLGHYVALRGIPDGRSWVYLALLGTFASDTAAFFTGRAIGKRSLAPQVSPNKTWEGAAGGGVGAVLISLVFLPETVFGATNPLHIGGLAVWQAIILGILISVSGQVGDLAESLLKRNAEAKDSGNLFPGHGGALDRLDSVLFAGIVVYYYVVWAVQ